MWLGSCLPPSETETGVKHGIELEARVLICTMVQYPLCEAMQKPR